MGKYFGTDGFRGEANMNLTADHAFKVGRFLGHDSEQALHGTCEKFITRFRCVEEQAGGKPLTEYPISQLEQMWQDAKKQERTV